MLFLDSSNPKEVEALWKWGVLSGVTTNPLIISREMPGADLEGTIRDLLRVSSGPVSVELTEAGEEAMLAESQRYHEWNPRRICIKVPMSEIGLRVVQRLRGHTLSSNATCLMSAQQALLAALAGAAYVSLFWGRIADMGHDPAAEIDKTRQLLDRAGSNARIIAGSIRSVGDVAGALLAGAHVVTVPPAILRKMVHHPRTEETIQEFASAWEGHLVGCKR